MAPETRVKLLLGGLVIVLALGAPSAVSAEQPLREFSLNLGQAIVVGDEASRLADSVAFSMAYIKRLRTNFSAGFELGQTFGHSVRGKLSERDLGDLDKPKDGKPDSANFTTGTKATILWLTPVFRIGKSDEDAKDNLRSYIMLGGGYYITKSKAATAKLSGKSSAGTDLSDTPFPIGKTSNNDLGLNFGGGFVVKLGNRFEMGGDLRYHYIFAPNDSLQLMFPSAHFGFLF